MRQRVLKIVLIVELCILIPIIILRIVIGFNPLSSSSVLKAFTKALMHKKISEAHSLSSPVIWDEIDEWIKNSKGGPVECSFQDAVNGDHSAGSVCSGDPEWTSIDCTYFETCWTIPYEFIIQDVKIERKGLSWQIVSIGYLCESWDSFECD